MNLFDKVGQKVINKAGVEGTFKCIDNSSIVVDYGNKLASYSITAFNDGYLKFINKDYQAIIDREVSETKEREESARLKGKIIEKETLEKRKKELEANGRKRVDRRLSTTKKGEGNTTKKVNLNSDEYRKILNIVKNKPYGTNTKKIYDFCCDLFGFDRSKNNNFGRQHATLYAKEATPEGYSVLMLAHSNLTNSKVKDLENIITDETYEFRWDKEEEKEIKLGNIRLIFAKDRDDLYYFFGVYKCVEANYDKRFGLFKVISEVYPF